jgi:hypothetical protein
VTEDPIHLQKLPGHRRGIINGASAWLAPDHILLVTSHRFKEEYKRYYLRDIQAIAIARASSYHLSSRSLFIGLLWTIALIASFRNSSMTLWVWLSALVLVGAWVYLAAESSCIGRIYTAVSSDPLPSVYRTWTARKFLEMIEPRIRDVQGEIDPGWIEAVAERRVGPETVRDSVRAAPSIAAPEIFESVSEAPDVRPGNPRTVASDIFLATLLLEAGADAFAFSNHSAALTWTIAGITLAQIAAAIFVFVDRNRGRLRSSVHKVAIAKLIWVSLLFYTNAIALAAAGNASQLASRLAPSNDILRGIDTVLSIAFVAAGLMLTYRPESRRPTTLLGS